MSAKHFFDKRDSFPFLTVRQEDPSEERFGHSNVTISLSAERALFHCIELVLKEVERT